MKKQSIDELFAKKLTHWEPKVPLDVWARIEAKQEKKSRRFGGWLWSIAASLTLLLTTGYLLWQNQPSISMGSESGIAQTEISKQEIAPTKPPNSSTEPAFSQSESTPSQSISQTESKTGHTERYGAISTPAIPAESAPQPVQQQVRANVEITPVQRKVIESEALIARIGEPSLSESIEVAALDPKATTVPENRVIRATVDWDEPAKTEEPKDSRFAKIMQQLKNAKQGEAVDWKEVGFNPRKILARADEKIRNEEDKVSRKYQELKDKTKL